MMVLVANGCDYTKTISLYSLNGSIVRYMNYISLKLLKTNQDYAHFLATKASDTLLALPDGSL